MKRNTLLYIIGLSLTFVVLFSCSKNDDRVKSTELKDLKDSASFALGYLNGMQASMDKDAPVNADLYARGFKQAFSKDTDGVWDTETMRSIIMEYARRTQENMQEKSFEQAKPDLDRANKFLEENAKTKDIKTTQSGLQYKIEKQGKGKKPIVGNGDRVILQYTQYELTEGNGWELIRTNINKDGKRPGPTGIDGLCLGVKEALSMMNAGSHYIIWFHPNLGYGDSPKLQMYDLKVLEVLSE